MLPFAVARAIVQKLKLGGRDEWREWSKSGARPSNIPSCPDRTYRGDGGWVSYSDWLGKEGGQGATGATGGTSWNKGGTSWNKGNYLPFKEARASVQTFKLTSAKEWKAWKKSGGRPSNIPSNPHEVYRDDGWISLPDWLGYERSAGSIFQHDAMLPFTVARAIVGKLKLGSRKEWQAWSKAGGRPSNIPSTPHATYRDNGWISYPDWLGYGSEGGASGSGSSSSSSSTSSSTKTKEKTTKKKTKTKKTVAPQPPPPRGNTTGGPSRKRARAASGSDSDSDDDTLGGSSGPPQTKIKVEEVGGFSIVSSASDLKHTDCGLLQHGPPPSC